MKYTGERVVWNDMKGPKNNSYVLFQHLYRYVYAISHIYNKSVLDASAGTCYGSFLLSMVAKKLICADISKEALEEGKKLPFCSPVEYIVADFNKTALPKADVCVSFETIEHLENAPFFLKNLKTKELIFSIPLQNINPYHKLVFVDKDTVIKYLESQGWHVFEAFMQGFEPIDAYVIGRAKRK